MLQKATHQQTKLYNSQFVFKTIYDQGLISRADVARQTRLTRVTVSEIVAELIEKGLVAEVGRGPSTGGKTPILLSVVEDARHLISLDLADDVFRGAVINLSGKIVF
jgi:DNA-binding MarR family transcriptional regulator